MGRLVQVSPGELRLPPSRPTGADPLKLAAQIHLYGQKQSGMPPLLVTRCKDGELMINDGVTRASRVAKLDPDATISVEIIDERPTWSLSHLPRVKETL